MKNETINRRTILKRHLAAALALEGKSRVQFAREVGYSYQYIVNCLSGLDIPHVEKIIVDKILEHFPDFEHQEAA